jgi:peroxiredoxin
VTKNKPEAYPSPRSLADSRINRDGLPAGSPAPGFHLPQLDGTELSLKQYRGKRVLLIFSDPGCGPCDELAPELERLHRGSPDLQIVMVSRGDQEANRKKIATHQLTFPVVLQKKWEISRKYGMFAMPIGFLIDEQGITAADVAVGGPAIISLAASPHTLAEPGQDEYIEVQRLQKRLHVLRKELSKGQERLQDLAREQASTRDMVLRISGAAQVLEELLADRAASDADSPASALQAETAAGSNGQLMTSGD